MFRQKETLLEVYLSYLIINVLLLNQLITAGTPTDKYIGCFYNEEQQSFPSISVFSNNNTLDIEQCINKCGKTSHTYAALKNGDTCLCQNDLGIQLSDEACRVICSGNHAQYCGGIIINQTPSLTIEFQPSYVVYAVCPFGNYGPRCDEACHCNRHIPCDRETGLCPNGCHGNWTGPACNTISVLRQYIGCYQDYYLGAYQNKPRDLEDCAYCIIPNETRATNNTPEFCTETCAERNFTYAGTEYEVECFCGDSYGRYGRRDDTDCNMPCPGDTSQMCGGFYRNGIYSVCPVGYYGRGCNSYCNCVDDQGCIYRNGSCPLLCKPGWKGPSCNQRDCLTENGDCYSNEICSLIDLKYTTISQCRCSTGFQRNRIWENCTDQYKREFVVYPTYGPIAGGTLVSISVEGNWSRPGSSLSYVSGLYNIYIGDVLRATNIRIDTSKFQLSFKTPAALSAMIGRQFPITVEFLPGPFNVSTRKSFTYRDNPEISRIRPNRFPVSGGTLLTATGSNLHSVANPLINVTVVITRQNETSPSTVTHLENCDVQPGNGSLMLCKMPVIQIPEDFLQILNVNYSGRSSRNKRQSASRNNMSSKKESLPLLLSRRKRFMNVLSIPGPNGKDMIDIYIGFIQDGYNQYENINNEHPDIWIIFYSPPEINSKHIITFDSSRDEVIYIEGRHMKRCCEKNDYEVTVGSDVCENVDLTDNQLSCRPPNMKPQKTTNDIVYCSHLFRVYIRIGNKDYHYGCLLYSKRKGVLALVVGLTAGMSLLVFLVIIILTLYVLKCRNRP